MIKEVNEMLMDLRSGIIKISDDLIIHPQYSFEDFQKTRFYKGQADNRKIILAILFSFFILEKLFFTFLFING